MENESKNFLKVIIILLVVIIVALLCYAFEIIFKNKESVSVTTNNVKEAINSDIEQENNIIIGINDCFIGCIENDIWYNIKYGTESNIVNQNYKEFYLQDIESYKELYIHEYNNDIKEITNYVDKDEGLEYIIDETGKIIDDHFRFNSFTQYVSDKNINNKTLRILTNCNKNIFTIDMNEVEATEAHENIVNEIKSLGNFSNIETEISNVLKADYDNDKKDEILLIVNTTRDSEGYVKDENGTICFLIAIDDDNTYDIVFQEIINPEERGGVNGQRIIDQIILCDLDYDGNTELFINEIAWDSPKYVLYEYNQESEKFDMNLYRMFAW